ncbi:MAG: hypothetical protein PVG19_10185 [Desulfobacterales bacterium]|jgi:hypothetical protein
MDSVVDPFSVDIINSRYRQIKQKSNGKRRVAMIGDRLFNFDLKSIKIKEKRRKTAKKRDKDFC